ncbi:hypothetical protein B0537_06630 [Desulforamulus ferrireducens]|uniref:Uncharacterized protein n=1 Tax=Desulforamulus ferrireducens TaxID=1833852 RepID=A0A1S6IVK6_9FIRM|nr:hypothetical protein B0537_06630 [Desulforamulus ferrireducens]
MHDLRKLFIIVEILQIKEGRIARMRPLWQPPENIVRFFREKEIHHCLLPAANPIPCYCGRADCQAHSPGDGIIGAPRRGAGAKQLGEFCRVFARAPSGV